LIRVAREKVGGLENRNPTVARGGITSIRSDPNGEDDVTTVNQLYLPANKPIIVKLRSKDVIHSFGVPARMRGFVTVLPADEFQKWLDPAGQGTVRNRPVQIAHSR